MNALEAVAYLRRHLGDAFVNWILADPNEDLSPEQTEVAVSAADALRNLISNRPDLPIGLVAKSLSSYRPDLGTTFINYLRNQTAGPQSSSHADSGDRLA